MINKRLHILIRLLLIAALYLLGENTVYGALGDTSSNCECTDSGTYFCYTCVETCGCECYPGLTDFNCCCDFKIYIGESYGICTNSSHLYCCHYTTWETNSPECGPSCSASCGSCSSGTYYSSKPSNYYASGSRSCTGSDCSTYSQTCYSPCPTVSSCASEGWVNPGSCPSGRTCVPRTISESVPSGCNGTRSCLLVCPEISRCSSQGYIDPGTCPSGSTCVPRTITESVPSGCSTTRNCIYQCPVASCTDYDSGIPGVDFYDSCPTGDCREADLSIEIEGEPDDCPHYTNKTCYTPNPPTEIPENTDLELRVRHSTEVTLASINSYPNNLLTKFVNRIRAVGFDTDTVMHYWSDTHSGREISDYGLNNPVGLHAEYSDSDGQEDIVALYVWWSPEDNKTALTLPNKLDTTGTLPAETDSEDNWGFLVTRTDYNGTWDRVYVPNGSNGEWVDVGSVDDPIEIRGSNGNVMVELSGINVRSVAADPDEIHLDLLMTFPTGSGNDIVATDDYNLYALANDYVGFTAFETNGDIKDSDNSYWEDSNEDWALDMEAPTINLDTTDATEGYLDLSMNITDDLGLAYVRVDACETGMITSLSPIYTTNDNPNNYNLLDCNDTNFMADVDITQDANLREDNPTELPNDSTTLNETLEIYLNTNDEGAITFWVTAIDKAGNLRQETTTYRLGQWVMVENGLTYGGQGVSSSTRDLDNNAWDDFAPQAESEIRTGEGFEEEYADLTDQALLGGNLSPASFLGFLEKVNQNNSFKASNFKGPLVESPYNSLITAYQAKKSFPVYGSLFIEETSTTLLGSGQDLTDICSGFDPATKYCIVLNDNPINIESDFTCNGRALIVSSQDINISPDFTNSLNSDACILLAGGDINISQGDNKSGAPVNYDILRAFLVAEGNINIASDNGDNGLFVQGGIVAFGNQTDNPAILNSREILWDKRTIYPVIAVNNVAKYGILSRTLFGSQINIYKSEIGFKPY